jgi:hypothetical protein
MGISESIRAAARAAACAALLACPAAAQETVNFGSVGGRVVDEQNGVVPDARVVARQADTNQTAEAASDGAGRFRFPYLRVGRYEIVVTRAGFAAARRAVTVTVGSAFELPITLHVAGLDTAVSVAAEAPLIEAARSQIAGSVSHAEIRSVPLNGRHFLDLALLVPGVSPTNIASTQLFPETSAVPGQGLSIASQRNLSNNFIVDGLSANDDAAGLSGIPYGVDAIDQFQVVTSGGQAELGRALGGYINVVTRSGTNAVHGTAYGFFRDDALNARNALSRTRLPMDQQQYGASLGGPVVRNRTFYFATVEQRLLDQSGLVTIAPADVAAINARLAQVSYPGAPIATGVYANPVRSATVLGKLDHVVGRSDQLSVRYSLYRVRSDNARGAGALNAPSASAALDNVDQSIAFGNTWTLSPTTVNETRAQFASGDLKAPPSDATGPAVSIAGVASFGTLSGSPTARHNRLYQLVNNLSHQAGAHAVRVGADFLLNDDTITYPRSARGSYAFSSLASFLAGTYSGFTQTFGDPVVSQANPNLGVYVQDEWRTGSRVTLNLGLRYDLQFLDTVRTDTDNISPRAGFAWTPSASQALVVRGSAGLFFDRVPLRAVANAILSAGNSTDLAMLRQPNVAGLIPAQAGAPVFPTILPAQLLTTTLVDFTTMDRRLQNASSRQASLEVERAFGRGTTVSVGYQYVRGRHLLMSINQNVPTCVAAGANNGCRPEPGYRNNNQYSSAGESETHGLHVSLVQRPVSWAQARVSYTLSKSMNDLGEAFFSSPVDPTNVRRDWGRSDNDQRHRLVMNGTVELPLAFQLGGLLQYYSSLPFNITSGVQSLQGTAGRPLAGGASSTPNFDVRAAHLIPRNAGSGSDFFSVTVRGSRSFAVTSGATLEGLVEVFNLTNRANPLTRNTNFGTGPYPVDPPPAFNRITAVGDSRSVQLGLRLTF